MSKCVCIIPARSGSKRIKNKNIILIKNKPLIYYTIKFAKELKFVDEIIFSSDSKKYLKIAKKFGITNLHLRPKYLSNDSAKTVDVIKYDLKKLENDKNFIVDKVLLLQPTTPFREIKKFNLAYKILKKSVKYDSVITVNMVKNFHPYRMKVFNGNLIRNFINLKNESFEAVKNLKKIYIRSGSMYFFKKKNLAKYNSILGNRAYGIEVKDKYTINIDEKDDLIVAKHYLKK